MVTLLLLLALAATLSACGGLSFSRSVPPASPSLSLSPLSLSVPVGQSATLTATVGNSTNPVVAWEVNSVIGGDASHGTISKSGVYSAPAVVPNPADVKITAIAQADSSVMAEAKLTVVAASSPVSVSPSAVTLAAGASDTFSANVNGVPSSAVTWQVHGVTGGDAMHGTITAQGVYTAPLTPPPTGGVTITAMDQGGAGSGVSAATDVFSNASFHGPYAFSLSGSDASGFLGAAGSFTADGNGNIAGGLEDINARSGVSSSVAFLGTYFVESSGVGFAFLNLTVNGATTGVAWQFALVNDQHAVLSNFYRTSTGANGIIVTGAIDRQDASALNTSALQGGYVASLSGVDGSAGVLKGAGAFTADGAGSISAGVLDVNDNGVPSTNLPLSNATYTIAATGRGTLSFTTAGATQNYAIYVVNASQFKLVETDAGSALVGALNRQAAGPLTNASLSGGYAFTMDGTTANGAFGLGGVFTADGAGTLNSGVFDENDFGIVTAAFTASSASYNVAANGRATATLALNDNTGRTLNLVLYPQANGSVAMLDVDNNLVIASGTAYFQTGPLSQSSLDGGFALNWNGTLLANTSMPVQKEFILGILVGSAGNLMGALEIATQAASGVGALQGADVTGPFTTSANGRGTAALAQQLQGTTNPFTQAVYLVDSNTALTLDTDSKRVLTGILKRQF